jgi:hypothetical protein
MQDVPYGFCHCGCGGETRIARYDDPSKGWTRGEPLKYIAGHAGRWQQYEERDCGYTTPCWVWLLSLDRKGYGQLHVDRIPKRAHRVYYERAKGPIPDDLPLDHLCRNRACVNPAHLEPVTMAENIRRGERVTLTASDVREIRRRRAAGEMQKSIAAEFGVDPSTVSKVVSGERWAGV